CGTAAMNYFSKLKRITSNIFPHLVLDQYRELLLVARIWRVLKLLKWKGLGHDPRAVGLGELVLFCLACPQKGVKFNPEINKDMSRKASKHPSPSQADLHGRWKYS
ncbi:hypothetical protein PAXRUDRAFT_168258, partial [Paxillus rubicundulus Ve08.2h10]